ncbi:MAG: DNA-processing protein DprA [Thermoguttaceae bacterium]
MEKAEPILPGQLLNDIVLTMIPRVGSLTIRRLLDRFGEEEAILSASARELQSVDGIGPVVAERIANARNLYNPNEIVELCQREEIDILSIRDTRYPELLRTINDPPRILYVRGSFAVQDALSIAVVGTRRMTPYGKRQTARLTSALAQHGLTIISGLAKGIDAVAHKAALDSGGRTIAVLGSGLLRLYPAENSSLAKRILEQEQGVIISEYAPLTEPFRENFPQRNRITSGLSLGTLIVEAPERSGAMITARLANEQGREVFAVPGPIDSEQSRGCLKLISDGAILTESAEDILEALGPLWKPIIRSDVRINQKGPNFPNHQKGQTDVNCPNNSRGEEGAASCGFLRHPRELQLNEIEERVLRSIQETGSTVEQIVDKSNLQGHQVETALFVLAKKGLIAVMDGLTVGSDQPQRFRRL